MFGYVKILIDDPDEYSFEVMDVVRITLEESEALATIEWHSGIVDDPVADSAIAIIMSCDSIPASVKISSHQHSHAHIKEIPSDAVKQEKRDVLIKEEDQTAEVNKFNSSVKKENADLDSVLSDDYSPDIRLKHISMLLHAQFGDSFVTLPNNEGGTITIGKHKATIDYKNFNVDCKSNVLRGRIEGILRRSLDLVAPLSHE